MIKDFIGKRIESQKFHEGEYGIEIEAETKEPYIVPKFKFWSVKKDSSLRDFGQEYILNAPVRYDYELDIALGEFRDKTSGIPFIQNSISTSVHVHWNILNEKWKTLGNFCTLYTLYENLLIEYSGEFRRNNLFCLPLRSAPLIPKYIEEMFRSVNKKSYAGCFFEPELVKYAALNLSTIQRFGSLEMRSFRGTTDINVIKDWITIIHDIVKFSRQDITPCSILDIYKDNEDGLFRDVFAESYHKIRRDNQKELIENKNLFLSGQIGYCLLDDQWNSLDVREEKKISSDDLDYVSTIVFGTPYLNLTHGQAHHVMELLEQGDFHIPKKKEKILGQFAPEWLELENVIKKAKKQPIDLGYQAIFDNNAGVIN